MHVIFEDKARVNSYGTTWLQVYAPDPADKVQPVAKDAYSDAGSVDFGEKSLPYLVRIAGGAGECGQGWYALPHVSRDAEAIRQAIVWFDGVIAKQHTYHAKDEAERAERDRQEQEEYAERQARKAAKEKAQTEATPAST